MTDAWVFPLGHLLGPFHPGEDEPVEFHRVRIGADVLDLSPRIAQVWYLAHGLGGIGPGSDRRWTRSALVDAVRAQGDADAADEDAADAVTELIGTGALVEVGTGAMGPARFARGHRFQPLLMGLGSTVDRPDLFHIGLVGEPIATVDALTFDLWQWAPRVADLRELVEVQAATAPVLGDEVDDRLDYLLWRLHVLLTHGCGYLDVTAPAGST